MSDFANKRLFFSLSLLLHLFCSLTNVFSFKARLAEFKAAGLDVDLEFLDDALVAVQGLDEIKGRI